MSTATYVYRHNGLEVGEDVFKFKLKTAPANAWGHFEGRIEIVEPPARLQFDLENLDFGEVFVGDIADRELSIKNAGGGILAGTLEVAPPWSLKGKSDFSVVAGAEHRLTVEFRPNSAGETKGVMEVAGIKSVHARVTLSGTGRYKFDAPSEINFPQVPGSAELELPIKNLVEEPLTLTFSMPAPLEGVSSPIVLAPLESTTIRLGVPARHSIEKKVTVLITQDSVVYPVEVVLPPPLPLLKWNLVGESHLGEKPPGSRWRLEARLQNEGPLDAVVQLRPEGSGLNFEGAARQEITLPAFEGATVALLWELPEGTGSVRASITATAAGAKAGETLAWTAVVKSPPPPPQRPPNPTPTPAPTVAPTPTPPPAPDYIQNIVYRLEPAGPYATAILSWTLSEGISGEGTRIERQVRQRAGFFDSNPFKRDFPLPETLPEPSLQVEWKDVPADVARIHRTEQGRWEGRVPKLSEGFHCIRILVPEYGTKNTHGVEIVIEVGRIPHTPLRFWLLLGLSILLFIYVLRNAIRRAL
jgi:hypothetical protein